jgi:tetratricopeptide (TPR) repeat protein
LNLRSPGVLAVLSFGLLFTLLAWAFRFTIDDTYISLRYAKNLVEGHGLVFNRGERVEGYSNFLWTILLALLLELRLPAVDVARWAGVAFSAAAVFLAARFVRAFEGKWGVGSVWAAFLAAANPALALWSTSGLETGLYVCLVTAALERAFSPQFSAKAQSATPVLLALASLTRPESPLLFALVWTAKAFEALRSRALAVERGAASTTGEEIRRLTRDLLVFGGLLLPYVVWKLAYYGDLLPNTYYAKAGVSSVYVARGIEYGLEFARGHWFGGLVPLIALLALGLPGERHRIASVLFVFLGYSAYVVAIGGDVFFGSRFWLPLVPLGCSLVSLGALAAARALARRTTPRNAHALVAAFVVAISAINLSRNWESLQQERAVYQEHVDTLASIGRWLGERLGPEEAIALTPIGAVSYFSERPIIDMLGLADAEIARHPELVPGLADTWKERKYNAGSVLRRRPAVILFSTGVRPSSNSEKALFLYDDFHESYYAIGFRTNPASAGTETLYRLRPRAKAPPAKLSPRTDFRFVDDYAAGIYHASPPRHDIEQALAHFGDAAKRAPPAFTSALEWQACLLDDRNDPSARALLEGVVARDSLALKATGHLAARRLQEGDVEGAEKLFARYRDANPESPVPWEGLAEIARRRENLSDAAQLAEKALSLWSRNVSALILYGNVCLLQGRAGQAASAYQKALSIQPGLPAALRGIELAARLGATGAAGD